MTNFRIPPASSGFESYKDVRRKTLNFENTGGERHSRVDITDQPMVQIYNFLAHAAKSLVTRSH